jgi:hypothetical protein
MVSVTCRLKIHEKSNRPKVQRKKVITASGGDISTFSRKFPFFLATHPGRKLDRILRRKTKRVVGNVKKEVVQGGLF